MPLYANMLELEAFDSAGSLISIALAAGHLPHTCLKGNEESSERAHAAIRLPSVTC